MAERRPTLVEKTRQLQGLNFQESSILTRDMNKDSVYKSFQSRLSGSVQATYGSGTPVSDSLAAFDNIIPRIEVQIGGGRTVKSVRPHLMRMQQLLSTGSMAIRRASAGASPALGNLPTAEGGFPYGTTGQYTTVAESILVSFEMVYANPGLSGRELTWLDLRGAPSAEIKYTTASFDRLKGFGNTAPVVFGNSTLVIDIFTREVLDAPYMAYADWKQTTKEYTFSGEQTDFPIDIGSKNELTGIGIFVRDGAAGSATTATGKVPSNLAVTKLNLKVNGSIDHKFTNFLALQDENRQQLGLNAPIGSNVSVLDGYAHMNLLTGKDIRSALDLRRSDSCQLFISTSNLVSYTNPVSVTLMTEELVRI